ncbi:hypothetical protein H9655_21105 [Cytobacillus sp. Sa5YUA1]|uniref:KTSC domain-containing protein n=1 Tax=Cytobacillus stercorigallinarum TaxID=2762240 RepID=A0ABR8QVH3_9BACI|nr:hypothetical protein [Cytobacillus stercorigallinarum]MBD7939545.1 hypothetical protein [Cytobacillus stercorigallinarum]
MAFTYEIIRGKGYRKPQLARVTFDDGSSVDYLFGHYLSEQAIADMLPRLVMDAKASRRKAVG